ncbi:NAD(+) diphosphatase [Microbacterium sp. CFH 90308]|uniref:NAD(+) diphosphatase n=1 Tax=Microbacterium salsuginis TaxID=2722803 RepID=A0ABX1KFJ3_9MICO|nr:NAD(+) diphosphatase [Microbacterium sp. CFH 90308]NLP85831.1 NAD(+) diphosphatase [Microbacterium sp. CFH 90308]
MTAPHSASLPPLARAELDRAAEERMSPGLVEAARSDPSTRVLVIESDRAPLAGPDTLLLVGTDEVPDAAYWAFLGRDANGAAVLAAVFPGADERLFAAPAGWAGLRTVGGSLSARDAGIFVEALSLGRWLLDAPHCPACGAQTDLIDAGWSRRCPACGRQHFPRTDPAVIVAITSAHDPDLLLLGSNALWGANRYSCFAGFVEAGESLEAAVQREVAEESGIEVDVVSYRGSQAWPYPRSLMVGFLASAVDDGAARPDGEEIVAVRWFTRDEIGAALAGDGDVALPGPSSIAHRLISDWHAGPR